MSSRLINAGVYISVIHDEVDLRNFEFIKGLPGPANRSFSLAWHLVALGATISGNLGRQTLLMIG